MKNFLIICAHADTESFNAAIKNTVAATLQKSNVSLKIIDLYADGSSNG